MTNHYLPTRADELRAGDVVRWPDWFDGELPVKSVEPHNRGFVLLWFDGMKVDLAVRCDEVLDKRIAQEARDE